MSRKSKELKINVNANVTLYNTDKNRYKLEVCVENVQVLSIDVSDITYRLISQEILPLINSADANERARGKMMLLQYLGLKSAHN